MEDIFASGDKDFASFVSLPHTLTPSLPHTLTYLPTQCGRTPEQVRSGTGLKGMELRRFASSRKSPSTTPQTTKRSHTHHTTMCGVYMSGIVFIHDDVSIQRMCVACYNWCVMNVDLYRKTHVHLWLSCVLKQQYYNRYTCSLLLLH